MDGALAFREMICRRAGSADKAGGVLVPEDDSEEWGDLEDVAEPELVDTVGGLRPEVLLVPVKMVNQSARTDDCVLSVRLLRLEDVQDASKEPRLDMEPRLR